MKDSLEIDQTRARKDGFRKKLGYAVCLFGTIYKVPQVLAIIRSGSAEGVSKKMVFMDALSTLFELSYSYSKGHPISTYGETPAQLLCSCATFLLCVRYQKGYSRSALAKIALAKCVAVCALMHLPSLFSLLRLKRTRAFEILSSLKSCNVFLVGAGKVPQIAMNAKTASAGQLSFLTTSLALMGNIARIVTGWKLGMKMIGPQAMSMALNFTLSLQILRYGTGKS